MRVLVLGGTHHVGRAVVEAALARGDEVTTLNRGVSGPPAAGPGPGTLTGPAGMTSPPLSATPPGTRSSTPGVARRAWSGTPPSCSPAGPVTTAMYPASRSVYR
ncbi:MAG: hypothetical protein ACHP9Z_16900 [Streptosporangiales bacterium]